MFECPARFNGFNNVHGFEDGGREAKIQFIKPEKLSKKKVLLFQKADAERLEPKSRAIERNRKMRSVVTPLFGKAKVKLTQTPRAVTPFGGRASFIAFWEGRGFARQVQTHLDEQAARR
jgi:hypothetical protein